MSPALDWFRSKSFGAQLFIFAAIVDPLGAVAGYLLHPQLGVEPIVGVALGLVAANIPMSLFVFSQARKQ